MKEKEIRPKKIFDKFLHLTSLDIKKYFYKSKIKIKCIACGKKGKFSFKEKNGDIEICYKRDSFRLLNYYESYLISKKFDLKKIKVLTGLIYLNMSPLHHYPFDKFLYSLGIFVLNKELKNDRC